MDDQTIDEQQRQHPEPSRAVGRAESVPETVEPRSGTGPVVPSARHRSPLRFVGRVLGGYWRRKWLAIPLTILVVAVGILAVPASRYPVLALFVKQTVAVVVTDSVTGNPVSGAPVVLDNQTQQTNSAGAVNFTVPVGRRSLMISKTYYRDVHRSLLIDIMDHHTVIAIKLIATGRQVPVKVINKLTGKPVPEALLTIGSVTARTNASGEVTVVLPAAPSTQPVILTADGYSQLSSMVQITTAVVPGNSFALIPAGRIYFLSNLSGKVDVVSTALDGSDRKVVLAGTGNEDAANTVLLVSRDWQYLALLSKRDAGNHPKLFLITTATGALTTIDSSASSYSIVGWNNHYFVYQAIRGDDQSWIPGAVTVKSYNADTAKSVTLATTNATGTNMNDAQYENIFQTIFIGNALIYTKTWYRYPGYIGVSGQQNVLMSVKADGTGSKALKSVDAAQYYISNLNLAKPNQAYLAVYDNNSSNPNYYRLDANGNLTQSSTITSDTVSQNYPTYFISPAGSSTFWTEPRDGKNTLFVGDANGLNGNQIASLSDYAPYGWFSDDYVLVQKGQSELYIMPVSGGTPVKIADYYKPSLDMFGYGGGYGGI
jgi:hypothetical protein